MNSAKKLLVIWAVVGPLLGFVLGPGFIWEWRKTNIESARLDIDRARASYDLREKMNPMLFQILKLEPNSPERIKKEEDFNAAEKNLALIEGRTSFSYTFTGRPSKPTGLTIK